MLSAWRCLAVFGVVTVLAACHTPRWSERWEGLSHQVQASPRPRQLVGLDVIGVSGYRFGTAGALVALPLSPNLHPGGRLGSVAPVYWAADEGLLFGHIVQLKDGSSLLLAWIDRLTLREWVEQPFLLTSGLDGTQPFFIGPVKTAFDIDLGRMIEIPGGVAPYACVAAEARVLAQYEFALLQKDVSGGRLTITESQNVQEKLSGYLASGAAVCN